MAVDVLRLGHRLPRDERMTTHLALTARIFGVRKFYYSGQKDTGFEETIKKVQEKWGGNMNIIYTRKPKEVIRSYPLSIHLTMYGLRVEEVIKSLIEEWKKKVNALVIVGSEKVPGWVYRITTHNVSVTNQPHSEITAFSLFMHELLGGKELTKEFEEELFKNKKISVIPSERGKKVIHLR